MKFFVDIKCPGCKLETKRVFFKKPPKLLSPVHSIFRCDTCESHIAVRLRVPNGNEVKIDPGQIKIQAHVSVKGATLIALEEDEKKHLQSAES